MNSPEFTVEELNVIGIICAKADPMELVEQTKSIRAKIQEYFASLQKEQIDKTAKEA